jgi:lysophospholipase L1-like esterase
VIVCIGDSLTAGQFLPEGDQPWPSLITGYELIAAGVSGDTTRLGLERFPHDVQERKSQAVVIQFGHNDCNRWDSDKGLPRVSPTAYRANLQEMIQRCRAFGADPFLCSLTPSSKSERYQSDVSFYDGILRGVGMASGTPVIPVREAFMHRDDLFLPDGLHLNHYGHKLYAGVVQSALDRWQ